MAQAHLELRIGIDIHSCIFLYLEITMYVLQCDTHAISKQEKGKLEPISLYTFLQL